MRSIKQFIFATLALTLFAKAGDPPKVLGDYMEKDKLIRAEVVRMVIPEEFFKFDTLIAKLKIKEPEWFAEHMKKAAPGDPIPPFDAKFGITKKEYDQYLKHWNAREYKKVPNGDLVLKLTETSDGKWIISKMLRRILKDPKTKKPIVVWEFDPKGMASDLGSLTFDPKTGSFTSLNGEMKRIGDINSPAANQYGAWAGHEWRFFEEGPLSTKKENIAIGRTADKKYGILIYSRQEVSRQGQFVDDKQFIIRFVPKKVE